jgi:hypothetical protein
VKQQVSSADAASMAGAIVPAMRMFLGHDGCPDRCQPLVEVLDEFCSSKECVRPLPPELIRGLLREQLRNLHNSSWTKQVKDGAAVLRTLNVSCVMLLNGISRHSAFGLLLELGTEESEAIAGKLVVKCLQKLNKGLRETRHPELDVQGALDAIRCWLRRAQARLPGNNAAGGPEASPKGLVDAAVVVILEGAKEVVAAARDASPEVAASWLRRLEREGGAEELELLRGWMAAPLPSAAASPVAVVRPASSPQGAAAAKEVTSAESRRLASTAVAGAGA